MRNYDAALPLVSASLAALEQLDRDPGEFKGKVDRSKLLSSIAARYFVVADILFAKQDPKAAEAWHHRSPEKFATPAGGRRAGNA